MAEGDKFFIGNPNSGGQLIAEQRGYKVSSVTGTFNKIEIQVTNTYWSNVRPELLMLMIRNDMYMYRSKTGLLIPLLTSIMPPPGAVFVSSGMSPYYLGFIRLESGRITNVEVTRDHAWLVTTELSFVGQVQDDRWNDVTAGEEHNYAYDLTIGGGSENRRISRINELVYGDEVAVINNTLTEDLMMPLPHEPLPDFTQYPPLTVPPPVPNYVLTVAERDANTSAGSPIEMEGGSNQVTFSMKFRRPSTWRVNAQNAFGNFITDPLDINLIFRGSVNNNVTQIAGAVFNPFKVRIDQYTANRIPVFDEDSGIAVNHYYEIDAQVTYDPKSFFREMLDCGFIATREEVWNGDQWIMKNAQTPFQIWMCPENDGTSEHMRFGSKTSMQALETRQKGLDPPPKAEKATSPILLDGMGGIAELLDDGRQRPHYRWVMKENLVNFPNLLDPPTNFYPLFPIYRI